MAIPTYDRFIEPLLRLLAKHPNGLPSSDAYDALADEFSLTDADRNELLPSGVQPVYHNRIGWARDRLRRKGLVSSVSRGVWALTPEGRAFVKAHKRGLSDDELRTITVVPYARNRKTDGEEQVVDEASNEQEAATRSPEERIEEANQELRGTVSQDLLAAIMAGSPRFFETLVLDLLHAMGYGTSRAELQHVGGSGDGGIDGVVSLDRLGLEKVYIQAKRWANTVGRPDV